MYRKFYHLTEKPFNLVPNPAFLYKSSKHENALTYLEYGLLEGIGFILLTGEIGSGKTTLVRYILNQIDSEMDVAVIFNTNVSSNQIIELILSEFELVPEGADKTGNLEILYEFLIKKFAENRKVLLIIDEAQNLSDEVLEEIRMLSNLQTDDKLLLQIMLVGQPELKTKLKSPRLAQLSQRIAASYHLQALSREETGQYIAYRLKTAGGDPELFNEEAIDVIHQASGGIPRTVNLLCDAAMVYGFADEMEHLDAKVVEQVIEDKRGIGLSDSSGTEDSSPAPESDAAARQEIVDSGLIHTRIKTLEQKIQKIQLQVDWQIENLEQKADASRNELIAKLKDLLLLERQKNEELLVKNYQLNLKLRALKNMPAKRIVPDVEEPAQSPSSSATSSRQPRKKWLRFAKKSSAEK